MDKLLVLGSYYGGINLIQCAHEDGISVIVTDSYDSDYSILKKKADKTENIDVEDINEIVSYCISENVSAIFCGVSDKGLDCVRQICIKLQKPFYGKDDHIWKISRNKRVFKQLCIKYGIPVAKDYYIGLDEVDNIEHIQFPIVVKPVDQSANRGVCFCNDEKELKEGYCKARSYSNINDIIVEKQIVGEEYVAYYILTEEKAIFYYLEAACNQPEYPKFCYSGSIDSKRKLDVYIKKIDPLIKRFITGEGLKEGMIWFQFKVDSNDDFYAIECGYRMSGSMLPVAVDKLTGFNHVKWMLDTAFGKKHKSSELPKEIKKPFTHWTFSYLIWTRKEGTITYVSGISDIEREFKGSLVDLRIRVGDRVKQYVSLGLIVFVSEDFEEMKEKILFINKKLRVTDECKENLIIYFDDFNRLREA